MSIVAFDRVGESGPDRVVAARSKCTRETSAPAKARHLCRPDRFRSPTVKSPTVKSPTVKSPIEQVCVREVVGFEKVFRSVSIVRRTRRASAVATSIAAVGCGEFRRVRASRSDGCGESADVRTQRSARDGEGSSSSVVCTKQSMIERRTRKARAVAAEVNRTQSFLGAQPMERRRRPVRGEGSPPGLLFSGSGMRRRSVRPRPRHR